MEDSATPAGPANSRYRRQIQFRNWGEAAQQRLRISRAVLIGCGALGTVIAEILVRAGIGTLRLVDRDLVQWDNLHRQSLFTERDARRQSPKAVVAARRLQRINHEVHLEPLVVDVTSENVEQVLAPCDLILDACDNFETRFLINETALDLGVAWVHGGCVGTAGQVYLFRPKGMPCFRCIVAESPAPGAIATCDTAGVIPSATHTIGALQANEALKWLSGQRSAVADSMLTIDLWENRWLSIDPRRIGAEGCATCRDGARPWRRGETSAGVAVLCGRDTVQLSPAGHPPADLLESLALRWQPAARVELTRYYVRLHLPQHTMTVFRDGRALIGGTSDPTTARTLWARWMGA
jgi:adenylyltransferase/sulfurtransferase